MKRPIYLYLAISLLIIACSKDDNNKCDSCKIQGETIEICDNGDGTYNLKSGGETQKINESDLGGLTAKEFVNSICALGAGL